MLLPLSRLEIQRASALVEHLNVDDAIDLFLLAVGRILDANSKQAVLAILGPEHEPVISVAVTEGERVLPSAEQQRLVGGIRLRQAFRVDEDADAATVGDEGARASLCQSRTERLLCLDAQTQYELSSRGARTSGVGSWRGPSADIASLTSPRVSRTRHGVWVIGRPKMDAWRMR